MADALKDLSPRPLHLICGMLNTKDVRTFLRPFAGMGKSLHAVSIPGETATLKAEETARAAHDVGLSAVVSDSVENAIKAIRETDPSSRILICGSLYLAGHVLRLNG